MAYHLIPTAWQRAIYRNYGTVKTERLATALIMTAAEVEEHAEKLGLKGLRYDEGRSDKGFVTVFRKNWDLLSDGQIRTLLGWTEERYRTTLVEYDFLDIKLGEKPAVTPPVYAPLTETEEEATARVRALTEKAVVPPTAKPFDFFKDAPEPVFLAPKRYAIADRYTAGYCASYSGVLLDDDLKDYDEAYLARLASTGVNGIWLQEALRNLAAFPFDESYSPDYKIRVRNLRKLTERCEKYGIGVYLYLNEPRSLPSAFFEKYPKLRGQKTGERDEYCLCTSTKEVQDYLYGAVRSVAENVPKLKGLMTITMSENPTHCYSKKWQGEDVKKPVTECPRCRNREPEELTAELNNIFCRALKDGNGYTRLIANLWSWADFMFWTDERVLRGVDLLDQDVDVLCVSEFSKEFELGGVKSRVIDYSISKVGPSEITKKTLARAQERGHRLWAKIQANNSWECSSVPYLPTFDLMLEHIRNLKALGVSGLMMGWSLGGWPGGALPLCVSACGEEDVDENAWYQATYGDQADTVRKAEGIFSEAFREFPFSIDGLYLGGQNLGCGNFWSLEKDERISTMVCYTFDDYATYTAPYGVDVYLAQYAKMNEKWQEGLTLLDGATGNGAYEEFVRSAKAAYIHFESARLLTSFSRDKADVENNREKLLSYVRSEFALTEELYRLIGLDPKIGFEMTNHYYYDENVLLEKRLNLLELESRLS